MSGAASISGLASGLDTATIIDQLMSLEAIPQARLANRKSSEQLVVNALQTLNSKVASLATKAADLAKPAAWTAVTATSSNAQVAVTTGTGAAPGSFSLRVDQTALSHRLELAQATGLDTAGSVPTSVRLDRLDGSAPLDLTTDGTLRGLVAAINDPANESGLRATAIKVGDDSYRLLVESTATGAASDFTLADAADASPLLGGATVRAGRDAQVTLGDSITATSATNTFAELAPGVTVTLSADAAGTSEVSVARNSAGVADSMKALVDAVNAALADIDSLTAYNPTTKASGLLSGDTGVRSLRSQILDTVFPTDGTTLADLGIQTDRSGKLVFDRDKFSAAHAADPTSVQARLTTNGTGFIDRMADVAKGASDKVDGTLTTSITGRNTSITRLTDDIDNWDLRLELRRTALTRQFTALETALSQMNSQSSWLAGQISSLSSGSGS
jgi:flagellar hook-associated protein 2